MDDLTDNQIARLRELCAIDGITPEPEPLQRLAFVGLVFLGMMLDHLAEECRQAAAAGKPGKPDKRK